MSWDSYIDNVVGSSTQNCDKVCIVGLDGGAMWTTATHAQSLKLSVPEAQNIARALKNKDFGSLQGGGVMAEGIKYRFLRDDFDGTLVLAKMKDQGALTIQASKTAIVIAHVKEGGQAGNVNTAVDTIVKYLEGVGM